MKQKTTKVQQETSRLELERKRLENDKIRLEIRNLKQEPTKFRRNLQLFSALAPVLSAVFSFMIVLYVQHVLEAKGIFEIERKNLDFDTKVLAQRKDSLSAAYLGLKADYDSLYWNNNDLIYLNDSLAYSYNSLSDEQSRLLADNSWLYRANLEETDSHVRAAISEIRKNRKMVGSKVVDDLVDLIRQRRPFDIEDTVRKIFLVEPADEEEYLIGAAILYWATKNAQYKELFYEHIDSYFHHLGTGQNSAVCVMQALVNGNWSDEDRKHHFRMLYGYIDSFPLSYSTYNSINAFYSWNYENVTKQKPDSVVYRKALKAISQSLSSAVTNLNIDDAAYNYLYLLRLCQQCYLVERIDFLHSNPNYAYQKAVQNRFDQITPGNVRDSTSKHINRMTEKYHLSQHTNIDRILKDENEVRWLDEERMNFWFEWHEGFAYRRFENLMTIMQNDSV